MLITAERSCLWGETLAVDQETYRFMMATAKRGNYETVVAGVQQLNLKLALLVIPVQFISCDAFVPLPRVLLDV